MMNGEREREEEENVRKCRIKRGGTRKSERTEIGDRGKAGERRRTNTEEERRKRKKEIGKERRNRG